MHRVFLTFLIVVSLAVCANCVEALRLLSPTPDQVVRERVKISIPLTELPPGFVVSDGAPPDRGRPFITLSIISGGVEHFVAAISPEAAIVKDGVVTFFWDSKAPYRDPHDAKKERVWKDGRYTLKVTLHDFLGKVMDTATVDIDLRNKVPRPNPAPAVRLVNRLVFGESQSYRVRAQVQVFQVVSGTALPILGGMGMTSEFRIIQSVEDRRPDGSYLLRCRMHSEGYLTSFGKKVRLFPIDEPKPELYRLVDKFGNVLKRNVFSRQARYTIMDVLPVLPRRPVREGDSWPTTCELKVEGITGVIPLTGTSQLDSFEWQNGYECAKIISTLSGSSVISIDNGRIRSAGEQVTANMTTYFAYKIGKLIQSEVTLDFPASIMPGAGQVEGSDVSGSPGYTSQDSAFLPYGLSGGEDMGAGPAYGSSRGVYGQSGTGATSGASRGGVPEKKGTVQIKVVVRLEK